MAFDDISCDFRGVTCSKIGRYAQALPDGLKVSRLLDGNGKACVLDMSHPTRAATAIWIFVNKDSCSLGRDRKRRHEQGRGY